MCSYDANGMADSEDPVPNFHFSHQKSVERKYMSNGNKNTTFVEANAINISAKFQLYRPYGFLGVDLLFFVVENLAILATTATSQIQRIGQMIYLVQDHSRNISVKLLLKYLQ